MTKLTERPEPDETPKAILEVTITYLEMHQKPINLPKNDNTKQVWVAKVNKPTVSFYRYLYFHIGEPWRWYERRILGDDDLRSIIHDAGVSIYVLYSDGSPAGYFELDARIDHQVELAYLGLFPEFIGRGLGSWLLDRALITAWQSQPSRVWVHTCSLDHPNALPCYKKAGFKIHREETISIRDPWLEPCWNMTLKLHSNNMDSDTLA